MQRISTAEKPFVAAKSRICAKGHLGQPRVEKASGGLGASNGRKGGAAAARAAVVKNSRRVIFIVAS